MTPHYPNIYQALACFGVGLAVVLAGIFLFGLLIFGLSKLEKPVEAWFLRHPRAAKWNAVICLTLLGCFMAGAVFYLGCSILEACR